MHVNRYYFYIGDDDVGPPFIIICYAPCKPSSTCRYLYAHEWAKRQLENSPGQWCPVGAEPKNLQEICDSWCQRTMIGCRAEMAEAGSRCRIGSPCRAASFEEIICDNLNFGRRASRADS